MIIQDSNHIKIEKKELKDTIERLFEAVIIEEKALAEILETKARSIEKFIGEDMYKGFSPTDFEILNFSQSLKITIDQILFKEWLLLRNIETIILLKNQLKEKDQAKEQSD
jgi:hypothetical protein